MLIGGLAAVLLVLPAAAARASSTPGTGTSSTPGTRASSALGTRGSSTFFIRGGGDGHGIGMSQYGAYGYALHGEDYQFILAHYYTGTALGATNPNRVVRVLLASGTAAFSGADAAGQTALTPAATYQVVPASATALKIIAPTGRQVGGTFASPLTVTGPAALGVPGLGTYRGSLQFRPNGQGGVQTINAVGLDDYVRGVVAGEMPSSWSAQALEAQAVAARTYAITTAVGAAGYDLYDDTRSEMYGGVSAETAATDAAVAATSGQIVTYRGQPAVTYFFSSSGGYTENIENVWAGASPEPWLQGVPDPYDNAGQDPYHQWGSQMTVAAAAAKLGSLVRGSLLGITVISRGASPRILTAAVGGTRGETIVSGATLQRIFGLATTYASFTTVSAKAAANTVTGRIYPAPRSGTVNVQVAAGRSWQTVAHATIGSSGTYAARGLRPGRYRVRYGALTGPTVATG